MRAVDAAAAALTVATAGFAATALVRPGALSGDAGIGAARGNRGQVALPMLGAAVYAAAALRPRVAKALGA